MAYKNARVDVPLNEVSLRYQPEGLIGDMVLTTLPAKRWTGIIPAYGTDHLELYTTRVRDRGEYHLVNSVDRSLTQTYNIGNHGLRDIVSERDKEEIESPFMARQDVVLGLSTLIGLEQENAAQTLMRASGTYDTARVMTLSGNSQWNSGHADSDPVGDFRAALTGVWQGGHVRANCAIIPYDVYLSLRFHPKLAGIYGQSGVFSAMAVEQLQRALGIEKILVPMGAYNNSGTETALWGKDVSVFYAPKKAMRMQRPFGYRVTKKGHRRRTFIKDEPTMVNADAIFHDTSYSYLITHKSSGYLIKNAIS